MFVIDVKQMRIVSLPANARYLALSYVWGKTPFIQLTKSNTEHLKRKGSLQEHELPRTIGDAINLVSLLDERYLWVDALCIVQDDIASKMEQITQMDRIYLCAALTIVAAGGIEANSGLSGFAPGSRRSEQTIEMIGGVRFVVMSPPLSNLLDSLTWHSRGWTYQEFMLSKRMFFFTPQLVFHVCAQQSFAEDHYRPPAGSTYMTKPKTKSTKLTEAELVNEIDERHRINMRREFRYAQNFHAYKSVVEDLSIRHLTYEGDALKSMAGVLQAMTLSRAEKYICGLPSSMLEWGLLWQPKGPLARRGKTSTGPPFPSWSWIGWVGPAKYINHPGPEGLEVLIRDWQFLTDESQDHTKPKPVSLSKMFRKQTLNDKLSPAPNPSNAGLRSLLPYQPIVACIDPIWTPTTWTSWKSTPNPTDRLRKHQSAMDAQGTLIESGILHFTTTTSTYYIIASPLPDGYTDFPQSLTGSFRIVDTQGTWVGTVHLPLSFAKTLPPHCAAEFIALSRTHVSNEATNNISVGQNTFDTTALRELDQKARANLLVNVMWIRWEKEVAERVAVGQIHVHAWVGNNPGLKHIALG